ncbi:MAG: FAD-dependent oxidoreductase [Oscillospiraceae bacterium]|nr:FAD-dependent oxidoreductase [Oscillospiraceae bacterium]
MNSKFPYLLKPGKIGRMELNNRIVSAPMGTMNSDPNGHVTQAVLDYYVEEAKGGLGLIVVEAAYVDDILSKAEYNQLGLSKTEHVYGWAKLVTAVHDLDVKIVPQICHIGKQIQLKHEVSLGPSEMVEMEGGVIPSPIRGITREEMAQVIEDFGDAAARAKAAGCDGVQIHGAIDHLICMFCNPFYNKRTDEYGGSPEKRIRFFVEIIENVQKKCGREFPIIARLTGCTFEPDGITMEEGIIHAQLLEKAGAAALHVVGGSMRNLLILNGQYEPRGDYAKITGAMKAAGIKIPIILDGGFTTPDIAEEALAEGKADYIGLGRPTLADPQWANKVKEGRPEDIVPCIRCMVGCAGYKEQTDNSYGVRCAVNPLYNLYNVRKINPLEKKKKVCVIGGGPAGMEAARLATVRGHEVTMYEKRKLGGAMNEAAFDPDLKGDIKLLIDYYVTQMKKLNINILYEEATADKVLSGNFDAIIVAAGATPRKTKLSGFDKPHVYSVWEYCGGGKEVGDTVLIAGGGLVGCEIALSLAKKGKHPILVTQKGAHAGLFEIAHDNSLPMQARLIMLLMQYRVDIRLMHNLKEITDGGAILTSLKDKEQVEVKCDNVILCRGYDRELALYKELEGKVPELYKIGDCKEARVIKNAIEEGWVTANKL